VIDAAVLCPHPPLLLRELGGAQDPAAELRHDAVLAVRALVEGASSVVVVGGDDVGRAWDASTPVDVRRFGTTGAAPSRPGLPLSLGVGVRLLAEAGWRGPVETVALPWDGEGVDVLAEDLAGRPAGTVLLVLGDGSTRRGDNAPGYLDERAFPFDDAVAKALADGDAEALHTLDAALAAELMVLGATSFRLLGALGLRAGVSSATLDHRSDPFGVSWFVATWRLGR